MTGSSDRRKASLDLLMNRYPRPPWCQGFWIILIAMLTGSALTHASEKHDVTAASAEVRTATVSGVIEPGSYDLIDAHARASPQEVRENIEALTAYLIEPAGNDFERARAIFVWITHNIGYDATNYFRGNLPKISPAQVLREGKAVCFGYSGLFEAMSKAAGLQVRSIGGQSKGFSHQNRSRAGQISHAWNAVELEGNWYLLDATWGAGYLDGQRKRFVRRFQPHYFLTTPDQFILDHLPDDPRWQLLDRPVTERDFDAMVYLRPAFFQNALKLVSHTSGHIETTSEGLTVTVQVPEEHFLSARLLRDNQKLPRDHVTLERKGVDYHLHARFPGPGDYRFRIYAKQGREALEFDWVLDYTVTVR